MNDSLYLELCTRFGYKLDKERLSKWESASKVIRSDKLNRQVCILKGKGVSTSSILEGDK